MSKNSMDDLHATMNTMALGTDLPGDYPKDTVFDDKLQSKPTLDEGDSPDDAISELKKFLADHTEIEVLRHFFGKPIPDAPESLNYAKFESLDLECYINKTMPKAPQKITKVGVSLLQTDKLTEHVARGGIEGIIKEIETYHMRVLETCHMRNKFASGKDAEMHSLYAHTRFLSEQEIKEKLDSFFDDRLPDGTFRPVILLGHAFDNDLKKLKSDWNYELNRSPVVYVIQSITELAKQAGIHGDRRKGLQTTLDGYGIDAPWRHNGANDTVYALVPAILIAMHPILYPSDTGNYPVNSLITGRPINNMLSDHSIARLASPEPSFGYTQYCFYCDTAEHHDAEACTRRKTGPACQLCKFAPGRANASYRAKAKDHRTHRCMFEPSHTIPPFPDFLKQNLSKEELRRLSRAMFEKDTLALGELMWKVLGSGRLGDMDVEEWSRLEWMDQDANAETFSKKQMQEFRAQWDEWDVD